jgi:hypothetical protein
MDWAFIHERHSNVTSSTGGSGVLGRHRHRDFCQDALHHSKDQDPRSKHAATAVTTASIMRGAPPRPARPPRSCTTASRGFRTRELTYTLRPTASCALSYPSSSSSSRHCIAAVLVTAAGTGLAEVCGDNETLGLWAHSHQ